MKKCVCNNTMFTDSMCQRCLKKAESKLIQKISDLQDKIDEYESDLDQVQYYLNNPACRDCGENLDHCECYI